MYMDGGSILNEKHKTLIRLRIDEEGSQSIIKYEFIYDNVQWYCVLKLCIKASLIAQLSRLKIM